MSNGQPSLWWIGFGCGSEVVVPDIPAKWPTNRDMRHQRALMAVALGVIGVGAWLAMTWIPLAGSLVAAGGCVSLLISVLSAGPIIFEQDQIVQRRPLRKPVVIDLSRPYDCSSVDFHGSPIWVIRQDASVIEVPVNTITQPMLEAVGIRALNS